MKAVKKKKKLTARDVIVNKKKEAVNVKQSDSDIDDIMGGL